MQTFIDNQGKPWNVDISIGSIKRVKAALGVDLLKINEKDDSGTPLMQRLATDIELLVNVIWVLVEPQAKERDINDEQFAGLLSGKALADAETTFINELIDFFQSCRRHEAAAAVKRMMEGKFKAIELAAQKIQAVDIDQILGAKFTDSPASSESTPQA